MNERERERETDAIPSARALCAPIIHGKSRRSNLANNGIPECRALTFSMVYLLYEEGSWDSFYLGSSEYKRGRERKRERSR